MDQRIENLMVKRVYAEKKPPKRSDNDPDNKQRKYRLLISKIPEFHFLNFLECTSKKERTKIRLTKCIKPSEWEEITHNYKHLIIKETYIDASKDQVFETNNAEHCSRLVRFTHSMSISEKDFKEIRAYKEIIHEVLTNEPIGNILQKKAILCEKEEAIEIFKRFPLHN